MADAKRDGRAGGRPLADLIREEMEGKGLTQARLAALVRKAAKADGTYSRADRALIFRWRSGRGIPARNHLRALALALDLPIERVTAAAEAQRRASLPGGWPTNGENTTKRRSFITGSAATVAAWWATPYSDQMTAALVRYRLPRDTGRPSWEGPFGIEALERAVVGAKVRYQACHYADAAAQLSVLLPSLQTAIETYDNDDRLMAYRCAADAYHVAASIQLKLGNEGPAWIAADASMRAAELSQCPAALGCSARIITHVLMDARRYAEAQAFAAQVAVRLSPSANDSEMLSVCGSLILRGAIAAARCGDCATSYAMLEEAERAAGMLGSDQNIRWTAFGPTNVVLHKISVAVLMGNAGVAIQQASGIRPDEIPITERRASLFIDLARAYNQWGKHEQALQALLTAEAIAPEELSRRRSVHELVLDTWATATAEVERRLRALASRIGAQV